MYDLACSFLYRPAAVSPTETTSHDVIACVVKREDVKIGDKSEYLPAFLIAILSRIRVMQSKRTLFILFCCLCAIQLSAQPSPYITHVWEYMPAPGQFVNELPEYTEGDDAEDMRQKAEEAIAYNAGHTITLGGWGGYVVFSFDHEVQNVAGQTDLLVLGNAFYSDVTHPENGGSSEPGVVYVSRDVNGNGTPDDPWYEIAGSEIASSNRNYRVTYFRPSADHVRTPNATESLVDTTYIYWRDINGATGYMAQNRYHLQSYFPLWLSDARLTFNGTLLPPNAMLYQEDGHTKYVMMNYAYGYADNHPNNTTAAEINLDWAVNAQGQPANLTGIHFVKVQTGTHQQCGWIGEISTEVNGASDLHVLRGGTATYDVEAATPSPPKKVIRDGQLLIQHGGSMYTIIGLSR